MSFTLSDPSSPADPLRRSWRKCAAVLAVVIVAGCGGGNQPGVLEPVEGYFGAIAADEPRAAIAGRDILVAGGSAADAAVATAFMLAVALPSSAGLGGGGGCVAFDGLNRTATLFDFQAVPAGGGGLSVPGLVRGLALLHARHGRMPWAQLLGPAETAARFGAPVSRALARDLVDAPPSLAGDSATARIFAPGGTLIGEGESLVQLDLAAVLGQIRQKGAGEFYVGPLGRSIADASAGAIPVEALRGFLPRAAAPAAVRSGDRHIFIGADTGASTALLSRLLAIGVALAPSPAERPRVWAEAGAVVEGTLAEALPKGAVDLAPSVEESRALAARVRAGTREIPARHLGPVGAGRSGATSFVVVDRTSLSIACALGMNAPWGSGRVLPGTGMLAAPPPSPEGPRAVGVVVAVPFNGNTYLLAAASGRAGPSALAQVALAALADKPDLTALVARPRVAYDPATDTARIEPGLPTEALTRAGFKLAETAPLGHVNGFFCPDDMGRGRPTCRSATDPRGAGLAFGVGR